MVEQMRDSTSSLEENILQTEEFRKLIEAVVDTTEQVQTLVSEVDQRSKEQESSIQTTSQGISRVVAVSQQTAASSEEVYASSQEQSASFEEILKAVQVILNTAKESNSIVKQRSSQAEMTSKAQERIHGLLDILRKLSHSREIQSMDQEEQRKVLEGTIKEHPDFQVIYTADAETERLHYINIDLEMDTVAFRKWFRIPVDQGRDFISEVYVPLGSDQPCVTIAVPIKKGDQVMGVLASDILYKK